MMKNKLYKILLFLTFFMYQRRIMSLRFQLTLCSEICLVDYAPVVFKLFFLEFLCCDSA